MRRSIVTLMLMSVAVARPPVVAAASAYDSTYVGESAFLSLGPGETGSFTVFFLNSGTLAWTRGSSSQVDLAACLGDQVTCGVQDASEAPFNPGTWLSAARYATHEQAAVPPGSIATFTYSVSVPAAQANGTHRFNGDLVLASTGQRIHPEGYYHELRVEARSCATANVTTAPAFGQVQVGVQHEARATVTCAGTGSLAGIEVTFVVSPDARDSFNAPLTRSAFTDMTGTARIRWTRSNPGSDSVAAHPTRAPTQRADSVVRWTLSATVLTCSPTDAVSQPANGMRSYVILLKDPLSGNALAGRALDVGVSTYISTGTATINGLSAFARLPDTTMFEITTDAQGAAAIVVGGAGTFGNTTTVTPVVFLDEDASNSIGRSEFRVSCGSTSFGAT